MFDWFLDMFMWADTTKVLDIPIEIQVELEPTEYIEEIIIKEQD